MAHGDRSVDVFVRKLRWKIATRSPGWEYIHTHVGIGYRLDPSTLIHEDPGAPELPTGAPSDAPEVPESTPSLPLSPVLHRSDTRR